MIYQAASFTLTKASETWQTKQASLRSYTSCLWGFILTFDYFFFSQLQRLSSHQTEVLDTVDLLKFIRLIKLNVFFYYQSTKLWWAKTGKYKNNYVRSSDIFTFIVCQVLSNYNAKSVLPLNVCFRDSQRFKPGFCFIKWLNFILPATKFFLYCL